MVALPRRLQTPGLSRLRPNHREGAQPHCQQKFGLKIYSLEQDLVSPRPAPPIWKLPQALSFSSIRGQIEDARTAIPQLPEQNPDQPGIRICSSTLHNLVPTKPLPVGMIPSLPILQMRKLRLRRSEEPASAPTATPGRAAAAGPTVPAPQGLGC